MIQIHHRRLLVIGMLLAIAGSTLAEDDSAARRAELLSRRPANLARPFGGTTRQVATAAPEELPPANRLPTTSTAKPPPNDYIVVDDLDTAPLGIGGLDDSHCCSRGPLWVRGEVLYWWMQGFSTPALVTTSPTGTSRNEAGILGQDGTTILFGDERVSGQPRSGLRLTVGWWLNACQTAGVQASVFGLANDQTHFSQSSSETPILARPFYNVEPDFEGQDAELIAYPGQFSGSVNVTASSSLAGMELLLRHQLASDCCWRVDGLAGMRYLRLHDSLHFSDTRTVVGTATGLAVGTTFSENDSFDTQNQFYGAQLGVLAERHWCKWWLEGTMKVALGTNHSRVVIDGQSTATVPVFGQSPQVSHTHAGLLAQSTNIGTYEADQFTVVPELGLTVGYDINSCWRVTAGYTFLYWCGVARPGSQIDTNLNLSQLTVDGLNGVPRPQFHRVNEDLWAQGISLGLDYRF